MTNVNEGHRQRLRERMQKEGLKGFQDHEILELLLFQSLPRKDTNKLAHTLLARFGNLRNVLNAGVDELMLVKGVSQVTACNLSMLKEVWRRCQQQEKEKIELGNVADIIKYAHTMISESYTERIIIVYVDRGTKFLYKEEFTATYDDHSVDIDLKKVVTSAIRLKASGIIVFHCHVQGDCKPSANDVAFTERILYALSGLEVVLLEHVIFNNQREYYSFYDAGIIDRMTAELNQKIQNKRLD